MQLCECKLKFKVTKKRTLKPVSVCTLYEAKKLEEEASKRAFLAFT